MGPNTDKSRRQILAGGAGAALTLAAGAGCAEAPAGGIKSAIAITEVFGDGQKLTAIALESAKAVEGSALSRADFKVEGRTVVDVYTSTAAKPAGRAARGRYVIVALSPNDPAAALRQRGPSSPPSPAGGPPRMPTIRFAPAKATLTKAGSLSRGPVETTGVVNLVADDFEQHQFHDPKSGDTLGYNLFVPKGYDPKKKYPLVLFMHDAGATSAETTTTLRQGNGATVFASPDWQAKHPCLVLAPQFSSIVVNDASEATNLLDTTIHLVEALLGRYSVDRGRVYTTGQSGGGMMSIAMDIKYPGFFTAAFIVAAQWAPELCKPLAKQKMWVVVSEGDLKAFPGQNAIMAVVEGEGAKVARATWDGAWSAAEFDRAVQAVAGQAAAINYTPLRKGTVVPPGQPDNGGSNHVNTWRIAYTIEGVREWLFEQRK
jgi:predicted peptidase